MSCDKKNKFVLLRLLEELFPLQRERDWLTVSDIAAADWLEMHPGISRAAKDHQTAPGD